MVPILFIEESEGELDGVGEGTTLGVVIGDGIVFGVGVTEGAPILVTKILTVIETGRKFALSSGVKMTVKSLMPPASFVPSPGV